jgi:hypothetical protein
MKNAPLHLAALALAASALLVGAQAVQAAPAAKPDINGVWLITNYNPMLRAEDGSEPPLLPAAKAGRPHGGTSALTSPNTAFQRPCPGS